MSGPAARVTEVTAASFAVTLTSVTGIAGTTARLEARAQGSAADWVLQATQAPPVAVGGVLEATSLVEGASLEWRVVEEMAGVVHDGTHGVTTPAESIWSTLTAVVKAALVGQGLADEAIYIGRQPEPNYPDVCAVLRTLEERVTARANNVERVVYPIEVEILVTIKDDDGGRQKAELQRWMERVRAALHDKTAAEFVGIEGLEAVTLSGGGQGGGGSGHDPWEEAWERRNLTFTIWR